MDLSHEFADNFGDIYGMDDLELGMGWNRLFMDMIFLFEPWWREILPACMDLD